MDRAEWKKRIKEMTEGVGTYKPEFESIIATLADILEQRDAAFRDYLDNGAATVIVHISDRGSESLVKNPRLQVWNDLNTQALSYWRDLGLTPAGLKKIKEAALKTDERESALELALKKIGGQELENSNKVRGGNKGRKKGSVQRAKTSR